MIRIGLIRGIILVSLLAVLVAPLFTIFLITPSLIDYIVEDTTIHARQVTAHLTEEYLLNKTLGSQQPVPEKLKTAAEKILSQFELYKIRLFHADGTILFSTDRDEIGRINQKDYFKNVVAQGKQHTELVRKNALSLDGEPVTMDVVEVYVPIMGGETFLGALEVYSDITKPKKTLEVLTSRFQFIIFTVAGLLLVALVITSLQSSKKITARVRVEREAREHFESRFYELFNSTNSAVILYEADNDGSDFLCVESNPAAERSGMAGGKTLLGLPASSIYHNIDQAEIIDSMLLVHQSGETKFLPAAPCINEFFNGWLEHHIYRLSTNEIVVITDDVTLREEARMRVLRAQEELEQRVEARTMELKNTLEELEKSLDFNKTVLESIPDAVSIIDTETFKVVGANSIFYNEYGLKENVLPSATCHEITHRSSQPCQPPDDQCPLVETMRIRHHAVAEHVHYLPDGRKTYVEVSTSPVFDPDGGINRVVHVSRNITARKEAEESLKKAQQAAELANRAKSEFLAKISHELRTPLNGIIGFAELIAVSSPPEEIRNYAGMIIGESETLRSLLEQILDHAKIEAGRVELQSLPFDLFELLNRIERTMTMQSRKKGLDFSWLHDPEAPSLVVGDPNRLRQVLVNLLDNAVKYTDTGSIFLNCELSEKMEDRIKLRFTVTDTGIGIPEGKKSTILESFVQGDNSMARRHGGIGLGTTIVRQLAELMGGEMGFESQEGEGSTFWFTVILGTRYAVDGETPDTPIPGTEKPKQAKGRILVVEDYPANQEVARKHLLTAGHTVDLAGNGVEAVRKTATQTYDLILMDVQMPEMDGYEATRSIRSQNGPCAATPILAMTANVGEIDQQLCLEAGMNAVLIKPLRRKSFLETVNQWINRASPGEDSRKDEPRADSPSIPIDYDRALEEFLGDRIFLDTILKGFVATAVEQLKKINRSLIESDLEAIRKEAHAIKGGAANLVAMPLSEAASHTEILAREKNTEELTKAVEKMTVEFDRFRRYLEGRKIP